MARYSITDPMAVAISRSDVKAVKSLLNNGENVNAKDSTGNPPLHWAIFMKRMEIAKLLIDEGANVKDANCLPVNHPVHLLHMDGTPLHIASKYQATEIANMLLDEGANSNANDIAKNTPLHIASAYDSAQIVNILIQNDANLEAKNIIGCTPLHCATLRGNIDIVKILLHNGANVNAKDFSGATPLDIAPPDGPITRILIDYGAISGDQISDGQTSL